jgi:hypothetical protein
MILGKKDMSKDLTAHSLSHINANLLIAQNVDIRTVADCWDMLSRASR